MVAQLYFTATSCSAASYIAAAKAGILGDKLQANLADIGSKTIMSGPLKGQDFKAVNPKGNVPALKLDDGTVLNENTAVLSWIVDHSPPGTIGPAAGTSDHYLLLNKLSYTGTEFHASIGPLFNPALEASVKEATVARVNSKLEYLNTQEFASGKKFLVGDSFSVADSYLYICLSWLPYVGLSLEPYTNVKAYWDGIAALDFVKAAHGAMADIQ